jgi:hypothetical protein
MTTVYCVLLFKENTLMSEEVLSRPNHSLLILAVRGKLREGLSDPEAGRLSPIRHQLNAIGFLTVDVHLQNGLERYVVTDWRPGGKPGMAERDLVAGFWTTFERMKPKLVTFNGRGYGLPLLRYRAMVHGIMAPTYHQEDRNRSYSSRYSKELHFDVMDQMSEYGASVWPSLDDVRNLLGLPIPEAMPENPNEEQERQRAKEDASTIAVAYVSMRLLSGHTNAEAIKAFYEDMEKRAKT